MTSRPTAIHQLLDLGRHGIKLTFDDHTLADRACQRLYVTPATTEPCAGEIIYCRDESVADLIPQQSSETAVVIDHQVLGPGRSVLNLKVFNEFCVSIAREESRVLVRYPSKAPPTYLLDDVLQAAVQPFLEDVGGFILHGACLVKDGKALALMGSSGSGKSTTAFNLVRAGYHCYADDAIIVTRDGDQLRAWPFSREMSIRPLSHQLMESQGLSFSGYRQEGKKYYFRQPDLPANVGVSLHYACLIEVGGERATQALQLTRDRFHDRLVQDQRYFSFVNREHHDRYAKIVAELVPQALSIRLGKDLETQAAFFNSLIDPTAPRPVLQASVESNGRTVKLEQIRRAWRSPGAEPLDELVPMLGESDLTIFKNALSFFQNFPLAQVAPRETERIAVDRGASPQIDQACHWLRADEWKEGCRRLIQATCYEAYDQYAAGWFKSAPILYAFLPSLVAPDSVERRALERAWSRYRDASRDHVAADAPLAIVTNRGSPATKVQDAGTGRRFVFLSTQNRSEWGTSLSRLVSGDSRRSVIVVPVFEAVQPDLDAVVECVRIAKSLDLQPRLAPSLPLCWFSELQAVYLLEQGALAGAGDMLSPAEIQNMINADWIEADCNGVSRCQLSDLGLCDGRYLRLRHEN